MDTIPVFRAAHLFPHIKYLHKLGAPVDRKLDQARLPSTVEENPDAYIPLIPALKFLTDISRREGIEDFALRASEQLQTDDLDNNLVSDLIYAPSLHIALQSLCDNVSIEDTSVRFWLAPAQKDIRVYTSLNVPCDMHGLRFSEWQQNIVAIDVIREFAGPTWHPQEMAFQSDLPITRYDAERFPNTRLLIGQRTTWVTLPRTMLSLQPIMQHKGGGIATDSKPASELNLNFPSSLKRVLQAYFEDGYPDIQLAAEISGISVRSLQRRLKEFELSYSELVHHGQFECAVELLKAPHIRTLDVAYAVGYKDASNFARAFRRIAGVSPNEYRMQHLGN